mmetsp:Transcript_17445/g.27307  ORF Transcript_17445/g.27307 Transcript_17445/m.27307 type:complete len:140 (-) Transcript_17445:15-434(-)
MAEEKNEANDATSPLDQILKERELWEEIKKSLDAVMPTIDQIIRIQSANVAKPKKLQAAKSKKEQQINDFLAKLNKLPQNNEHVASGKEIADKLKNDLTANEMGNFNFDIRRYTQSIVKVRKELLDHYKKLKKEQEQSS